MLERGGGSPMNLRVKKMSKSLEKDIFNLYGLGELLESILNKVDLSSFIESGAIRITLSFLVMQKGI